MASNPAPPLAAGASSSPSSSWKSRSFIHNMAQALGGGLLAGHTHSSQGPSNTLQANRSPQKQQRTEESKEAEDALTAAAPGDRSPSPNTSPRRVRTSNIRLNLSQTHLGPSIHRNVGNSHHIRSSSHSGGHSPSRATSYQALQAQQAAAARRDVIKSMASLLPVTAAEAARKALEAEDLASEDDVIETIASVAATVDDVVALLDEVAVVVFSREAHLMGIVSKTCSRKIEEAQTGLSDRIDDLKAYLIGSKPQSAGDESEVENSTTTLSPPSVPTASQTNAVTRTLRELFRAIVALRELLLTLMGGVVNLSKKDALVLLVTPTQIKKKKVTAKIQDVHDCWQSLMMNLTLCLARDSWNKTENTKSNLQKLAVATGAPDWEDLTLNDGQNLYIQGEKHLLGLGVPQSHAMAYKRFLAASRCKHPEAMNLLGALSESGLGCERDISAAIKWYKESASFGCADAMNNIGRVLEHGVGVPIDTVQAGEWYLRAAERGHLDGMTNIGYLLETGSGRQADPSLAVEWYRMAAAQGHARAQNALGSCLYRGLGVPNRAYGEAAEQFREAAIQGNAHAKNNLGICFEEGLGVIKDLAMAKALYRAASEMHHASAANNYGYMLLLENNYVEAFRVFHLSWGLGSADAAYNIGTMYETGCADTEGPVVPLDAQLAIRWYRDAASKDSIKAQVRLATLLASQTTNPADPRTFESLTNLRKAAAAGSSDAQNLLGQMLELGLGSTGGEVLTAEAVDLYRKGATKGHAGSLYNLAACYEGGVGVRKDFDKAVRIYEEAERHGSTEAHERLEAFRAINDLPPSDDTVAFNFDQARSAKLDKGFASTSSSTAASPQPKFALGRAVSAGKGKVVSIDDSIRSSINV